MPLKHDDARTRPTSFDSTFLMRAPSWALLPIALICFGCVAMLVQWLGFELARHLAAGTPGALGDGLGIVVLTLALCGPMQLMRRCLVLGRRHIVEVKSFSTRRLAYGDVARFDVVRVSESVGRGQRVEGWRIRVQSTDPQAEPLSQLVADNQAMDLGILDRLQRVSATLVGDPGLPLRHRGEPARPTQYVAGALLWVLALGFCVLMVSLDGGGGVGHLRSSPDMASLQRLEGRLAGMGACRGPRRGDGPLRQRATLDGPDASAIDIPCVLPDGAPTDGAAHRLVVLHQPDGRSSDVVYQVQLDDRILLDDATVRRTRAGERRIFLAAAGLPMLFALLVMLAALTTPARRRADS